MESMQSHKPLIFKIDDDEKSPEKQPKDGKDEKAEEPKLDKKDKILADEITPIDLGQQVAVIPEPPTPEEKPKDEIA